jgi:diguanylate cyclase (GGDEF)-like protein/PAS domain S-box-containing protein
MTPELTEGRYIYKVGNHQWDIPALRKLLEEIVLKNSHFNDFEVVHEFPTIGPKKMLLNARRIYQGRRGTDMILLAIEDITERKKIEEALQVSEIRYRRLFETAQDGILILDANTGQIIDVNPFLLAMLRYDYKYFIGKELWEIGAFEDVEASKAAFSELQSKGYVRYEDLPLETKDGRHIDVEFVSNVYIVNHHKVIQCNIRDITQRKQAEEQLRHLSLHDALTGLYNRVYFLEEMQRLKSGRFDPVGIMIGDVDGLKLVNDTLGHSMGDTVLVTAANIIQECFRGSDVVSRVGGDEFAVLLPNTERNVIESACCRIRNAVSRNNVSNLQLPLSISLGFAVADGKSSMEELYKEADNQMYREKLHRSQSARSAIVQTLKKALEARDFMTEGHVNRLKLLMVTFAPMIRMSEQRVSDLLLLAQFHDIGKVGIPDSILFKPSYLTPNEYAEMQRHCEIGYRIAQSSPDLAPIADLILKHHEWWNGRGYPLGLKGEGIPLECCILAIADAYDSMTSERPYHKPIPQEEAVAELKKCAGTQFNPELVDKFVQILANRNLAH